MEKYLCGCKEFTQDEIEEVIREKMPGSLGQLIMITGAGAGCGRCIPGIRELYKSKDAAENIRNKPASQGNNRELSP